MNLSRVNSLICIYIVLRILVIYLFLNLQVRDSLSMVWCPKLAFESAAKKSFFLISEENVPEKYSEWNLSVEEEAEKRLE